MAFSAKQVLELSKDVPESHVRVRSVNGRELTYIEGWHAMAEANRIFGFDGWNRETLDAKCVLSRENRGAFLTIYTVKVRVTVRAQNRIVVREGHGTAEGKGASAGEAHDFGLKAAETDATKRALATFGKPFGLGLYGGSTAASRAEYIDNRRGGAASPGAVLPPDDTTAIPRPSRSYGREKDMLSHDRRATIQRAQSAPSEASLVPASPEPKPGKIDKSLLAIGTPRRLRDKLHLRFVATHPCLVCGRQPADAHHIQFAQPRAMGLKVSDEFTVPLCRTHHRELHQTGNEKNWWEKMQISPLDAAEQLWKESRSKLFPSVSSGLDPNR